MCLVILYNTICFSLLNRHLYHDWFRGSCLSFIYIWKGNDLEEVVYPLYIYGRGKGLLMWTFIIFYNIIINPLLWIAGGVTKLGWKSFSFNPSIINCQMPAIWVLRYFVAFHKMSWFMHKSVSRLHKIEGTYLTDSVNYKAVCRTAPATTGL